MAAIIKNCQSGTLDAQVTQVISHTDAAGLDFAAEAGIPTAVVRAKDFASKADYEAAVLEQLNDSPFDYLVLAGYMRIVGPTLLNAFPDRILNIHPSLLPSFKGLDAQKQALDYGVKIAGCTVHYVNEELDSGRIIQQATVPVLDDDTAETLADRILVEEHRIYSEAIQSLPTLL